jgi:hypothetical protein
MIILGAGLNGCIAAFRFPESRILEYLPQPTVHKAVLRVRSDRISDITNIPFKKVEVTKGIIMADSFVKPNLKLSNLYSRKVTDFAGGRSIDNLEKSIRWIAPDDFHEQMLHKLHNRIEVNVDYVPKKLDEPIISTIPLPILCGKIGIDFHIEKDEQAKPIYVKTVEFEKADLYQTIYYPDANFHIYRASMTGNMLIIESVSQITFREVNRVIEHFGLSGMTHVIGEEHVQQFGKFIPMEEVRRKKLMFELTRDHGVYSLGRFATWRKLLLDDSIHDMDVIERLIQVDEYDLRVGK